MTQQINQYLATQESVRSNKAREQETARHNAELEALTLYQNREQMRHNVATEWMQQYKNTADVAHNRAMLAETQRSNLAQEALSADRNWVQREQTARQIALGFAQLYEATRHNKQQESLSQGELHVKQGNLYYTGEASARAWEELNYQKSSVLGNLANVGVNLMRVIKGGR